MTHLPDNRPVLVGMNNPYNLDPHYALYPAPRRSAGYLLYCMLRDAHAAAYPNAEHEFLRMSYIKGFDRRNVLNETKWSMAQGREAGRALARTLSGRRVVVCGRIAADCLGIPGNRPSLNPMGAWHTRHECQSALMISEGLAPFTAWVIPHPSGLNQQYNDPELRRRTGALLLALYEERQP